MLKVTTKQQQKLGRVLKESKYFKKKSKSKTQYKLSVWHKKHENTIFFSKIFDGKIILEKSIWTNIVVPAQLDLNQNLNNNKN